MTFIGNAAMEQFVFHHCFVCCFVYKVYKNIFVANILNSMKYTTPCFQIQTIRD